MLTLVLSSRSLGPSEGPKPFQKDCHRIYVEMAVYCLQRCAKHSEASHITTLLECKGICQTSANFMPHGFTFHNRICGVCAEACERCAQECIYMRDDAQMQVCAEACRHLA